MTPRKLKALIDVHKHLNEQDYESESEDKNKVEDKTIEWHGQRVMPIDLISF